MKLLRILAVTAVAATSYFLVGCAAPAGFSYQNVTVTLTPFCTDCPNGVFYNPAYPMPTVVTLNSAAAGSPSPPGSVLRSEERRVGKEGRARWSPYPSQ